jgi:hypothetical protein
MASSILADLVLFTHFAFVVFALLGGLLALVWRWTPLVHLPAVAWGAYIELTGRICPLTPLENVLRRAAGSEGYSGGFIEHYLVPILYPRGLTAEIQGSLALLLVVANVAVYTLVVRRARARIE